MDGDNEIDISGIDPGALLAALHNGTRPLGLGRLHDIGRDMTPDEARAELKDWPTQSGGRYRFDYFHGRPLKVSFDDKILRGVGLYDRDAGDGACARAVAKARGVE